MFEQAIASPAHEYAHYEDTSKGNTRYSGGNKMNDLLIESLLLQLIEAQFAREYSVKNGLNNRQVRRLEADSVLKGQGISFHEQELHVFGKVVKGHLLCLNYNNIESMLNSSTSVDANLFNKVVVEKGGIVHLAKSLSTEKSNIHEVIVVGRFVGNLDVHRLVVKSSGYVIGNVSCSDLKVEEGATIVGQISTGASVNDDNSFISAVSSTAVRLLEDRNASCKKESVSPLISYALLCLVKSFMCYERKLIEEVLEFFEHLHIIDHIVMTEEDDEASSNYYSRIKPLVKPAERGSIEEDNKAVYDNFGPEEKQNDKIPQASGGSVTDDLLTLILNEHWETARQRICRCPWEVREWQKIVSKKKTLLFHKLPIHVALKKGSFHEKSCEEYKLFIQHMIKSYPESAACADEGGNLPLHVLAGTRSKIQFINNHEVNENLRQIMDTLYKAYPNALKVQNDVGMLPLHKASVLNASQEIVSFLYNAYPGAVFVQDNKGNVPNDYILAIIEKEEQKRQLTNSLSGTEDQINISLLREGIAKACINSTRETLQSGIESRDGSVNLKSSTGKRSSMSDRFRKLVAPIAVTVPKKNERKLVLKN